MAWGIRAINRVRLNFTRLSYGLAAGVLLITFPFFFLGGAQETSSSLLSAWWDCGHLVFFIALVVVLSRMYSVQSWRFGVLLSLAVFIGGGLIEIIQSAVGRNGSWEDLLRDLIAAWFAWLWLLRSSAWVSGWAWVSVWLARALVTLALMVNLSAVLDESWYYLRAQAAFPLLAGFETPIETHGLNREMLRVPELHTQGDYALQIKLSTKLYSGIKFARLLRDWRGFKRLSVDIYNADTKPFMMSIRVHDIYHKRSDWDNSDRFNRSFHLNPGWNHLSFALDDIQTAPAKRTMDMANISWVEIFVGKLPAPKTIYIDNLRLE
jgi:VanZ family protein